MSIDSRAVNNAAQFIRDYLSLEHFEDIDGSCPLIGFPSQVLQKEPRVRQAFETVLKVMIDVFEQALQRNGQTARNRARAVNYRATCHFSTALYYWILLSACVSLATTSFGRRA